MKKTPKLLAVSGKMASGKDAVAALALEKAGYTSAIKVNIADQIRAELDQLLKINQESMQNSNMYLNALLSAVQEENKAEGKALLERINQLLIIKNLTEPELKSSDRTNITRALLQDLGRLHRLADAEIWIRRHNNKALEYSLTGDVVLTTDVREPAEVLALSRAGFVIARILVSTATQLSRIKSRDNIIVTPETLNHPNELALDNPDQKVIDCFDVVISNDADIESAANSVANLLRERWSDE
ncbi:MAG: hypothetical protein ACKOW9_00465 [Candidatus Paceibacterota bacterium]